MLVKGVYQNFSSCRDYGFKDQIQRAAVSVMNNIAEGFDSEGNVEFARFLRYAKRSCTEVQSQLYLALDEDYITRTEFDDAYAFAGRTRAVIHGFLRYLGSCAQRKEPPLSKSQPKQPRTLNPAP